MKKLIYLLMAVLVLLAAVSCKKNPKVKDPSVKTLEATVEVYRAVLHGQIDFDPDAFWPSDYGFVWGTSEDSKGTYVQGLSEDNIAVFAEVRDLAPETDYWCKAVATFDGRSFTGEIVPFTTAGVVVTLDRTEYTFHTIGDKLRLSATVSPAEAGVQGMEWSSDNTDVVTVDQTGTMMAQDNGKATITVRTKEHGKTATCEVTVAQWVRSISLDNRRLQIEIGGEATLSVASFSPDNAFDTSVTWSSSDDAIASVDNSGKVTAKAIGNATIKATAKDGSGTSASCPVEVYKIDVPQAVDMGIVVNGKNIKWASFNIGASSPEEYGLYYAWGETAPKSIYSWSTYKFGTSESGPFSKYVTDSKYGTVDDKTVLEPEDDVAHVKLGGKWRMPTDEEWTELRTKCTCTWTTQNGVNGLLVTSTNGNSIFLPAAGYYEGAYYEAARSYGLYWSSSLFAGKPYNAFYIYFYSQYTLRGNGNRDPGFSVRPVREE